MIPVAAVSWAAHLGWLPLENTILAFLGFAWTPYIFTLLALGELINDKLPKTPSRKSPPIFAGRLLTGALCGAALGLAFGGVTGGVLAGIAGSIVGTFGGYEFRSGLVKSTKSGDLPIALLEDVIAVGAAVLIISRML